MCPKQFNLITTFLFLLLVACLPSQSTISVAAPTNQLTPIVSPTLVQTATTPPTDIPKSDATVSATSTPERSSDFDQLVWVSSSADLYNRVITYDPLNPKRLAYCASQEIRISENGGQSWNSIPTGEVSSIAIEHGYEIFNNNPSFSGACMSVTLDSQHPQSYFAIFTTAHQEYGSPPVFYMGFFTNDDGSSWQYVPTPSEEMLENFGGFWTDGDGRVEALFSKPRDLVEPKNPVYIQETSDGGATWTTGDFHCPASGPCLRWGPSVSNIPGMGSPLPQWVMLSSDHGKNWEYLGPPVELRAPTPNQLVAYSENEAAIISGSIRLGEFETEPHALSFTRDSGLTWEEIPLPPPPLQESDFVYYPGLQILPDRSLITQTGEGTDWLLLTPSSKVWCPINTNVLPSYPMLLQAIEDKLWWVNSNSGKPENIPLSEITCAGS